MLLTPAQIKPESFESRRTLFILPGVDASHVYVRAWALGCFHRLIVSSRKLSEGAGRVGGQMRRGDKECPFSGVTKSGRVCRKVPESGARSVTPSIASRHLPPNSARFSYATEGVLFISAQLSTDPVSALRKVRVLIKLWKQPSAQVVSRCGLAVRR